MTQSESDKDVQWVVYILSCSDNTLYTGITNNIEKRLEAHRNGTGAKYTRGRTPLELIYTEKCDNRAQASKREYAIKSLTRKEKNTLVKTRKLSD